MKYVFKITAIAAFSASLLVGSAAAHHSTAMFDWGNETVMSGVIEVFEWTNPHTFITMKVADGKGGTVSWRLEGMSPNNLGRYGWSKNTVKPGDKIEMGVYKLKDGRNGGFTAWIKLPNGKLMREVGEGSSARGVEQ